MPSYADAFQTVIRSVETYECLERCDMLGSRTALDFSWTFPFGQNREEVKDCLFGEPLNRKKGSGGDWWSSADKKFSEKLWRAAAALSDGQKQAIIKYVIGEMKTRNEKKMADDKKKEMAAKNAAYKLKAAEEKEAKDAKKRREAAADEYRRSTQKDASQAASQASSEMDDSDLMALPNWMASRRRRRLPLWGSAE
jgi:predicted kinase